MSTAYAHVWRAAQERLRGQLKRAEFDTWLRDTHLSSERDGSPVLRVRTTFACELVKSRYRDLIEAALTEVTGQPYSLKVAVMAADEAPDEEEKPPESARERRMSSARLLGRQAQRGYTGPTLFDDASGAGEAGDFTDSSSPVGDNKISAAHPRPNAERPPLAGSGSDKRSTGATGSTGSTGSTGTTGKTGSAAIPSRAASRNALPTGLNGLPPREIAGQRQSLRIPQNGTVPRMDTHGNSPLSRGDGSDHYGDDLNGMDGMAGDGDDGLGTNAANPAIPLPRLNPRYTFSTFIVGSANQLAHAASLAVADAPGQEYNPLFLYGGVGLGKTHLLHAIGHTAVARGQAVLYVSSETFTNEIVNAIRYRTTEEFRAKYRSADLLLVDDIQFIAGKESTEEEFFHTFNSLYETGRQIVICSDRPPQAMLGLAERLRSRFAWGLIADIQPPDLETRVAILRAKADLVGRQVPDEVISYLASRLHSNIRELEGGFNRLLAYSQLQSLPLTTETAKAALASLAEDGRQRRVGVDDVLHAVAEHFRIPVDDLRGKQRDKHIVVPRQIAMYLMRQETEASLLEIGAALGGRDHSTVLHGCDKINREVNENASLRKDVLAIRQQLMG